MITNIDNYKSIATQLVELLQIPNANLAEEIDACIDAAAQSWSQGKLRTHKRFKLPADVWARLAETVGQDLVSENYCRFLPPAPLLGLDSRLLDRSDVGELVEQLVSSWAIIQQELAIKAGSSSEFQVFVQLISDENWMQWIDPGDSPRSTNFDSHNGVASYLDEATRGALSELPESLSWENRITLLCGLWAGANSFPQIPEDWQYCQDWIRQENHEIKTLKDFGAARIWAMSAASPLYSIEDVETFDRFVSWAYRRASTWPTFQTIDPLIHARLREELEFRSTDELISPWVRDAVTQGNLNSPANPVVIERNGPSDQELLAELNSLIGLEEVKAEISKIVSLILLEEVRESEGHAPSPVDLNMVFTGNPGTGKTTVARLYGRILRSLGALQGGAFIEATRSDLVGGYLGQSAIKTQKVFERALGGVLFIDEAYSLTPKRGDQFGDEAVAEIVALMEQHRGNIAVIVAGYGQEMSGFMDSNPGLRSRFRDSVSFPDLSNQSLIEAFSEMASKDGYKIGEDAKTALVKHVSSLKRGRGFGNVREVRKLYSRVRENLAARYSEQGSAVDYNLIQVTDIPSFIPGEFNQKVYDAELAKLDKFIGLNPVKKALKQLAAQAQVAIVTHEQGISTQPFDIGHMAFLGRPGTGKTTVAEQVGRILASMGLLKSGHVVQANRASLVGQWIGQTAPKVREAIQEAIGGILFIDEAYALTYSDSPKDFGLEAVATLIDEMEKNRGQLVVICAGYEAEMLSFLDSNPGFESRVRHKIMFPDYSRDELLEITYFTVKNKNLLIEHDAAVLIAENAAALSGEPNFANARNVRNFVDDAHAALSMRLVSKGLDKVSPNELITITLPDVQEASNQPRNKLGFGFVPM